MQNLLHRLHAQGDAHIENHRCHDRGIDVFQPSMAEGMLLIRRLRGVIKSHHQKHHRAHVGDVIEAIAHDREESALPAGEKLHRPEDEIHQKTDETHPHSLPRT